MREAGVLVADAMHDCELPVFEQALESGHTRLNAELIIQPTNLFRL
jgi:hypothetical protein